MSEIIANDLGAWEDRPRRVFNVDLTGISLSSSEVFVLTRIDGVLSVEELCSICGIGERETLDALARLSSEKLIEVDQAAGERRLINIRIKNKKRSKPRTKRILPPFSGVHAEDAEWLKHFGSIGVVPGAPQRRLLGGQWGDMVFDGEALKAAEWLTVEHKKEILFLSANISKLDHYEFFDIEPTADRKLIRKAYFEFSKRFHPDTLFRKEVGDLRSHINKIFRHGSEVYDALTGSGDLRMVYCRAVKARDEHWRSLFEGEKVAAERRRVEVFKEQATGRKEKLKARLKERTDARREISQKKEVRNRLERAEHFFGEGQRQYENESYVAAANSLRLAVNYDPKNQTYLEALGRAEDKSRQVKAEHQWKRGYIQESLGKISEALEAYEAACDTWPRPEYCAHIAELFVKYDEDLRKAAELAQKAVDGEPGNVDYQLLLGRIYRRAKMHNKALSAYQRVIKLDPKNELAKKALKALKR